MIARTWRGWVRTPDRDAYVAYIQDTGIAHYRRTSGNHGAWMLTRDLDDGRIEIVTLSFWETLEAIRGSPATTSAGRCSIRRTTATSSTGRRR